MQNEAGAFPRVPLPEAIVLFLSRCFATTYFTLPAGESGSKARRGRRQSAVNSGES